MDQSLLVDHSAGARWLLQTGLEIYLTCRVSGSAGKVQAEVPRDMQKKYKINKRSSAGKVQEKVKETEQIKHDLAQ